MLKNFHDQYPYAAMSLYSIIQRSEQATTTLSYRLKHAQKKLARLKNHLTFLIRCRENQVIPVGLRITAPVITPRAQLIVRRASVALLRELICETRDKKRRIEKEVEIHNSNLRGTLDQDNWKKLDTWCCTAAEKVYNDTKAKQIRKFERLTRPRRQHTNREKVVRNLSNRALTEEEKEVLVP